MSSSGGGYFTPGKAGWVARHLNESPSASAIILARANMMQADINRSSPTRHVRWNVTGGVRPSRFGPIARLKTTSSIWHIIEFGSAKYAGVHSPAYRLLSRAAESIGLLWKPE